MGTPESTGKKGIDKTMSLRDQLEQNRRDSDGASGGGKGTKRGSEGGNDADAKKQKKAATSNMVCSLDGRPVKANKRFCDEHNTAHECIARKAMKGCDRKNKKFTEQAIAYMTIFGDKKNGYPGDEEAAKETIASFCRQFPPEDDGKKSGKPRGELDLTQFVRTELAARAIHIPPPPSPGPPCPKPTQRYSRVRAPDRATCIRCLRLMGSL